MPFEGADGFPLGLASVWAAVAVDAASGVAAGELCEFGGVDGLGGLAVAASVEAAAGGASAAGLDGRGAVGHCERCFGRELCGVSSFGGDVGCDDLDAAKSGSGGGADAAGEVGDVAVLDSQPAGAALGDPGAGRGAASRQSGGCVEGSGGDDVCDAMVVAATKLLETDVDAVDLAGAGL